MFGYACARLVLDRGNVIFFPPIDSVWTSSSEGAQQSHSILLCNAHLQWNMLNVELMQSLIHIKLNYCLAQQPSYTHLCQMAD